MLSSQISRVEKNHWKQKIAFRFFHDLSYNWTDNMKKSFPLGARNMGKWHLLRFFRGDLSTLKKKRVSGTWKFQTETSNAKGYERERKYFHKNNSFLSPSFSLSLFFGEFSIMSYARAFISFYNVWVYK